MLAMVRKVRVEARSALEAFDILVHDLLAEEVEVEIILIVACR